MERQVRDGFGKENESLRVIRIINALDLVQLRSLIKRRLVDEIDGQTIGWFQAPNLDLDPLRTQRKVQRQVEALDLGNPLANSRIQRRHQANLVSEIRQSSSERPNHVGQAAGFRVGMSFAAGQEDFHEILILIVLVISIVPVWTEDQPETGLRLQSGLRLRIG